MDIRNIVKKAIVTEKATTLKEKYNKYTFVVNKYANKFQIKHAVESLFNVRVESVHTSNYIGKSKRVGVHLGHRNDWKKAIIKLAEGDEIQIIGEA